MPAKTNVPCKLVFLCVISKGSFYILDARRRNATRTEWKLLMTSSTRSGQNAIYVFP